MFIDLLFDSVGTCAPRFQECRRPETVKAHVAFSRPRRERREARHLETLRVDGHARSP